MSRGGRGGGRGGFGGRGGASGGGSTMPPMGLSFADFQSLPREPTALYPPLEPFPVLAAFSDHEGKIADYQVGFADRLRTSKYYVTESQKSNDLERYSDKYRPASNGPSLREKDLNKEFFPTELWEGYFHPQKRRQAKALKKVKKIAINDIGDSDNGGQEEGSQAGSAVGSQDEEDYDVDEEYDNDYAENYFDNGEGDDDDLGGGGGGDDGGGDTYD